MSRTYLRMGLLATTTETAKPIYVLCEQCALPLAFHDEETDLTCTRCGHHTYRFEDKSLIRTLSFTLTALIFYFPAMVFPFMTMELNGNRTSSTIWRGVVQLFHNGSWLIAFIVLLASIVIPVVKLIILFYLALSARDKKFALLKTRLFRFIENIGRWSMLDIFLLAVLVSIMKIKPWTAVEPEIGSAMFAMVVVFTMLASASFDSRLLWKE